MTDTNGKTYPRSLRPKEKDLLDSVLPAERPGYRTYRDLLGRMVVLGEGRRGPGNFVLGYEGDRPDTDSPLPGVVAYGMVETTRDVYSVTVRECVGDQIDVEIVSSHDAEIPDHFEEKKRWTYSSWEPGRPSPATGAAVREVPVSDEHVFALAAADRRLWVYDRTNGMVVPVPITNYYNELMLLKGIRDPEVALHSGLLFGQLDSYTDEDLRQAFVAYNALRHKVDLPPTSSTTEETRGWKALLTRWFGRRKA